MMFQGNNKLQYHLVCDCVLSCSQQQRSSIKKIKIKYRDHTEPLPLLPLKSLSIGGISGSRDMHSPNPPALNERAKRDAQSHVPDRRL